MKRTFVAPCIALVVLMIGISLAVRMTAPGSFASGTINLDAPGNLAAVERTRPDHFAKIQKVLAEVPLYPPSQDSVATWMHTEFDARDVLYTDFVMTSLPAKKRLEFSLDGTSYVKLITLSDSSRPMARPLESRPGK